MRTAKSIKRTESGELAFTWSDGTQTAFPLQFLREECPCAGCKGESGLFGVYYAPPEKTDLPGKYDLKNITPVGNYALQLAWGDGHDSGVYTWELWQQLADKLQNTP